MITNPVLNLLNHVKCIYKKHIGSIINIDCHFIVYIGLQNNNFYTLHDVKGIQKYFELLTSQVE